MSISITEIKEYLSDVQKLILILLWCCKRKPIKGKLWLQKELLMIAHAKPELFRELDFEAYLFGPHSERLDVELDNLRQLGLVTDRPEIKLTRNGEELAELLARESDKETIKLAEEIKEWLNDLTEDELLAIIYTTFPNMTKESLKYKQVMKRRREIAIRLYQKGKVSLNRAAEIAGLPLEKFMNELKKLSISIEIDHNEL
ncbi:MAG: UPF0175 family protein [Candidatus Baldrarchaeia archaeon]